MANIARLRVDITGAGVVGPAVMTFYEDAATTGLPAAVSTLLNAIKANFPDDVTFTVPGGGDTFDVATGNLNGTWSDGGGSTVTGTSASPFQLGAGFRVKWNTGGIVNNRRVRGSTFMVPASNDCWASNGLMASATQASLSTALNTFFASVSGKLVIWSRPIPGRNGSMHEVTSYTLPTKPTALRSRRY